MFSSSWIPQVMNTKINRHICLKLTYVTDFKILLSMAKHAQIQK